MYGKPIVPKKAAFTLFIDDDNAPMFISGSGNLVVKITDLEDPSNDDIRYIADPAFDTAFPDNEMEGVFSAKEDHFKNLEDARQFLLGLGFTQSADSQ